MPIILDDLPVTHPLRNTPLIEIGAETCWEQGKLWSRVEKNWKIARNTYNDLGIAWTKGWQWRATIVEGQH